MSVASIQLTPVEEICDLHAKNLAGARTMLEDAIRIGELLTQQKANLKHGQWLPWIEENLPFSKETAQRYMRVYERREEIRHNDAFELTDAYRLLAAPADTENEFPLSVNSPASGGNPRPSEALPQNWKCSVCGRAFNPEKWDVSLSGFECPYCWRDATAPVAPTIERKIPVQLFTGDDENYTPPEFLDQVRKVLGQIDLDPASNDFAQKTVSAKRFFKQEDDGLSKEWSGRVFINPPYSNPLIGQFISKLVAEHECGNVNEAILLTNDNTDTEWFHLAASKCDLLCLRNGRISFYKSDGVTRTSPTNGQSVFYFGKRGAKFQKVFGETGMICRVL